MNNEERILSILALIASNLQEVNGRFEDIDKRFDEVNARFEGIDKRFDVVNTRFEGVDKRFDKIGGRLDGSGYRLTNVEEKIVTTENNMVTKNDLHTFLLGSQKDIVTVLERMATKIDGLSEN